MPSWYNKIKRASCTESTDIEVWSLSILGYLHALNSSTIACNGSNVISLSGTDWESCGRLETIEWCHHVGLCRGAVDGGNGCRWDHRGGSHLLQAYKLCSAPYKCDILNSLYCHFLYIVLQLVPLVSYGHKSVELIMSGIWPFDMISDDITLFCPHEGGNSFDASLIVSTTKRFPRGRSSMTLSHPMEDVMDVWC